ncbi:hypothetical protein IID20_01915 [Patescibacteria group bacterium]|nr:hypothetical protein [Patescibacteria group bacterium]
MPIDLLSSEQEEEKRELFDARKNQVKKQTIEMTSPTQEEQPPGKNKKPGWWGSFLFKKVKQPESLKEVSKKEPISSQDQDLNQKSLSTEKPDSELSTAENDQPLKEIQEETSSETPKISERPSLKEKKDQKRPVVVKAGDLEISLMPERAVVIPRIVRSRFLLFLAILVIIFTIFTIVWLYADWYFERLGTEVHRLQGEIQLLEAKSVAFLEIRDEISALERKAVQVDSILNNHIYWTKFFTLLEVHTINDIYFGDFFANTSENIHLEATARDLISLAKQIVAFSQASDFVKELRVSGIRKLPAGVGASFDLTLVDNVFHK